MSPTGLQTSSGPRCRPRISARPPRLCQSIWRNKRSFDMNTMRIEDNEIIYRLIPDKEIEFRTLLMERKVAIRKFFFTDGSSQQDTWDISTFSKNTNLKSSISSAVTRIQKKYKKIVKKVIIKVKDESAPKPLYLRIFEEQIKTLFSGFNIIIDDEIKKDGLFLAKNEDENKILIIKFINRKAEKQCFQEISSIMGKIGDKYPNKQIRGIIIGTSIDESLKEVCLSNPNISLKTFEMNIKLIDG